MKYAAAILALLVLALFMPVQAISRTVGNCILKPGTQCPGVNFMGANLRSINLSEGNFVGGRMDSSNLMHANFQGADLRRVSFQSAELRSTDFREADLREANFRWSRNIESARFDGADLSLAIWVDGQVCAENSLGTCLR